MPLTHERPRLACRKATVSLLVAVAWVASAPATDIFWFIDPGKTNLLGDGVTPMPSDFRFELGVFNPGFTPTQGNKSDWAANWNRAQRTLYNPGSGIFEDEFAVEHNNGPFSPGANAWIWGFRGDYNSGEWILFRRGSAVPNPWTWPVPDPFNPFPPQWSATQANQVVLGTVTSAGMQSAAVANAALPSITWAEWRAVELQSTSLDGPGDDADNDGANNLLEFVFGTEPLRPGKLPPLLLSTVMVSGQPYMNVSVPRRSDRPATLVVEFSSNLQNWFSGPSHVEILSDTPAALVVRDRTVLGPARFARVRASLP